MDCSHPHPPSFDCDGPRLTLEYTPDDFGAADTTPEDASWCTFRRVFGFAITGGISLLVALPWVLCTFWLGTGWGGAAGGLLFVSWFLWLTRDNWLNDEQPITSPLRFTLVAGPRYLLCEHEVVIKIAWSAVREIEETAEFLALEIAYEPHRVSRMQFPLHHVNRGQIQPFVTAARRQMELARSQPAGELAEAEAFPSDQPQALWRRQPSDDVLADRDHVSDLGPVSAVLLLGLIVGIPAAAGWAFAWQPPTWFTQSAAAVAVIATSLLIAWGWAALRGGAGGITVPRHFAISPAGVAGWEPKGITFAPWRIIQQIETLEEHVYFYYGPEAAIGIPLAWFPPGEDLELFLHQAAHWRFEAYERENPGGGES